MQENKYYNEITNIIETVEVNSKVKLLQDNSEKLQAYWNIGRLIVEAQKGEKRASYGDNLIKKRSKEFFDKYGSNYSYTNMTRFRQFYFYFPKLATVWQQLSWSQIKLILPIKNANERNYYINQVILNNLSVRELRNEIKNKSFDRLSYADKENIKLIKNNSDALTIESMLKDPILIKSDKNIDKLNEKVLHKYLIKMLENKFLELGTGFTLAGHEYKINEEGHRYSLDLLFFNYKLNAFVVVELKTRTMKISDCDQLIFYTKLVDKHIKDSNHNKTIGLLIAKEKDKYIIKYATHKDIFAISYELIN